jgi:hypothetical protein
VQPDGGLLLSSVQAVVPVKDRAVRLLLLLLANGRLAVQQDRSVALRVDLAKVAEPLTIIGLI